jgi:hypothetical protein
MKTNKIKDRRIQKGIAQNLAPMYSVLLVLTTLSLTVKIALKLHPLLYITEIIALATSLSYYTITTAQKKTLFVKTNDEAITSIKNSAKYTSYMLHLAIFLLGEGVLGGSYFVYPLFPEEQMGIVVLNMFAYIFMGIIPLSFANKKSHKKGLLVAWNSEKSKTTELKRLKLWCTIQATCSGVIFILLYLYGYPFDYASPPTKLFNLAGTMAILFFIFSFMYFPIKKNLLESEKYANREAELTENSSEE